MDSIKTGEFIRGLRKEKDLTQQQFAELLHVSDKAVSRWETGRGFPDIGNLEDIAGACGVTVAELLKGERLDAPVTGEDIEEVSKASFTVARDFVQKKKWLNLALGFVIGAIILLLAVVHFTSHIPVKNAGELLSVEVLKDGEIVAVMDSDMAGYDVSRLTEPESGRNYVFLSGYDTMWHKMTGHDNRIVVSLGNKDDVDYVYYYPGEDSDQLIWSGDSAPEVSGGIQSLPRLVYNFWILAGAVLSVIGLVFCYLSRKKYFFGKVLKITMIPVSLTLSMLAVLAGRFNSIYGAQYYLTGIVLLAVLIYALFIILYKRAEQKR